MTTLYLGSSSQTEKRFWYMICKYWTLKIVLSEKKTLVKYFIYFATSRTSFCFIIGVRRNGAPLVICNCHRIVICKHIVLFFTVYLGHIFIYVSCKIIYANKKMLTVEPQSTTFLNSPCTSGLSGYQFARRQN
jgi:cytochrome c oxidase subunit IV